MSNEIIKFDYNSSHNNFPAIESLNPIDIGTERQFRFTVQMFCEMFNVAKNTIYSRIETLVKVGDLSVQNFEQIKLPDSNGRLHETSVYDLKVLNKLAMTMIDNPIAVNVREAFNDIIVQVETTGQYNAKDMPKSLPEALRAYADAIEAKELADKECERQRLIAEEAIRTKAQISDKKTASALGRVGGLVASNNRLKDELFANRNYRTIKAVARLNHLKDKDINWRRLKAYCINNDLEIKEVDDEKFGTVKSYPIEAFKTVYPELITE